MDSKILLDQHTKTITDITQEKELLDKRKLELDGRLGKLEKEYEELLDKTIAEEEVSAQKNADMEQTLTNLKVFIFLSNYLMQEALLTLFFYRVN